MTKDEQIEISIAHAQAAADMSMALVEYLRGLKLDEAIESLVLIRHRQEQVAGLIGQLLQPEIDETCSSRTSAD